MAEKRTVPKTTTKTVIPAETLMAIKEARSGKDAGVVDISSLDAFIACLDYSED